VDQLHVDVESRRELAGAEARPGTDGEIAGHRDQLTVPRGVDHGVDRDAASVEPCEQLSSPVRVRARRIEEPGIDPPLLVGVLLVRVLVSVLHDGDRSSDSDN
jgi:hypothetical protein